jgi:hypothetical protein
MPELSETFKRLKDDPQGGSQHLLSLLETFLMPFLLVLDEALDKRLVRTFLQCLVAIIRGRNTTQVLWLSELGSYLDGSGGEACSAAAGTKRVGKLLRSVKWTVGLIERYLLEKAEEEVQKLKAQNKRILCLWDGSVVEKAESEKAEGLCPVLSSKAKRRSRTKRGLVFNWPAPRLWSLEARLKLLGMVMLVYAFLLSLLDPVHHELIQALLRLKCHRTGKRCQNTPAPLYRLRWALSRLWDDYRPRLTCFIPPSDDPLSVGSFISHLERIQKNWG